MLGSGGQTISIEASACTNVRLKADDGTDGLGEQIALNADEAFELVKQGRAVLAGYQERPLTEFVDAAEKTLQDLDCIGPRCDAPRTLEVLQGELIDHGRTRLIFDGQKIDWYMKHSRGAPYHPQTQGKIERWHQTLKNRILLENYFLPGDLEAQIEAFVNHAAFSLSGWLLSGQNGLSLRVLERWLSLLTC